MKPLLLVALLLASTASAQVQKWEYATLTYDIATDSNTLTAIPRYSNGEWDSGNDDYKWSTQHDNLDNFTRNVVGSDNLPKFNIKFGYQIDFMNAIGQKGWELVGVKSEERYVCTGCSYLKSTVYWFKKQVNK